MLVFIRAVKHCTIGSSSKVCLAVNIARAVVAAAIDPSDSKLRAEVWKDKTQADERGGGIA